MRHRTRSLPRLVTTTLSTALAAVSLWTVSAVVAAPANAAVTSSPLSDHGHEAKPGYLYTCTVVTNGVRFRSGPGTDYPALGTVNQGQKMNVFHSWQNPVDGWWQQGDLWGGPGGVWIRKDYCY